MEVTNNTKDLSLFESGSGGELIIKNNDLVLSELLFQVIYISLFGGNVEASTLGNETPNEERFDFWANSLLFADQPDKQFNSETERVLNNVVLNSSGRLKIQQAVENDLNFLTQIANFTVEIFILEINSLRIKINLTSLTNQNTTSISFIYNNASNEVITEIII